MMESNSATPPAGGKNQGFLAADVDDAQISSHYSLHLIFQALPGHNSDKSKDQFCQNVAYHVLRRTNNTTHRRSPEIVKESMPTSHLSGRESQTCRGCGDSSRKCRLRKP
ncbi:unnamed protein product [Cercospora beticola]|nr:unnamed protein product [Cercospora beticola]